MLEPYCSCEVSNQRDGRFRGWVEFEVKIIIEWKEKGRRKYGI